MSLRHLVQFSCQMPILLADILDNGAFHKARALRLPPNVGLLFLPPYAPELNPIERLWRDLKGWLAPRPPTTFFFQEG